MTNTSQSEIPKGLKAAVIIMGVLLVVGFGVLVITIAVKANKLASRTADTPPATEQLTSNQVSLAAPFETNIHIPVGMEVLGTEVGDGVILIRVGMGGSEQIILVDAQSGTKLGVISLDPKP